jgi:hypothetical protein
MDMISIAFNYSFCLKKTIVVDFQTSCLTIHLIKIFCINNVYFDMTYLIIRGTLIMIYLFLNLHKNFE